MRGRKVAPGLRVYITPATKFVYEKALKSGLLEQFWDAGAIVNPPGCSPCDGLVGALIASDVCVATHISGVIKEFVGRVKPGDMIFAGEKLEHGVHCTRERA